MNKVIKALESNLYKLEKKEYEELNQRSKDEAVKAALYLAGHPAPTFPDFPLEEEYDNNMEKVADLLDDVYSQIKDDDKMVASKEDTGDDKEEATITDAEAVKVCSEWKSKYNVVIGVSWGNLPYDLQQQWVEYSCDYHLQEDGKPPSQENTEVI